MAATAGAGCAPLRITGLPRFTPPGPTAFRSAMGALALTVATLMGDAAGLRAAPADPAFPPASTFRSLQLTTLDCGRDNSSAPCERARAMADPLLDHPRLSGRCKDVLWDIRQKATVAPANSPQRREAIDASARDVTVFCRQQGKAPPKPAAGEPKPQGRGGFGFGTPGGGR
jgi:hypothetical protein